MRLNFRPFTMTIVSSDPTTETTVTLKDSAGEELACNFVQVDVSSEAGNSEFHRVAFEPADVTTKQSSYQTPTASVGTTASGVPSVYTTRNGTPAVIVTSDRDRVSKLFLQSHTGQAGTREVIYIIKYGQVSVGNNLRDSDRPVGV